jgi:hypothetical protein
MADIKPRVGEIPEAVPLPHVSLGKNFFKVELLVGRHDGPASDYQLMKPFQQTSKDGDPLSIDHYVATPGLSFVIRCKLARPAKTGALYGARVYIDSGNMKEIRKIYKKWGYPGDEINDDVDLSEADHYFMMNPGQQEYIINGFYVSPSESQRFVFAEPPRINSIDGDPEVDFEEEINRVGTIRIMFCCVDSKPSEKIRNIDYHRKPQQATTNKSYDEKIKMSTKPGNIIQDGCSSSKRKDILDRDILYERRLIYNTYGGFSARRTTNQYSNSGVFYKGMPLKCFLEQHEVRFQGVITFFREVAALRIGQASDIRIDLTTEQRIDDTQAARNAPQVLTNDWVCVEDIVHHVSKSLSPAASYILCTGMQHHAKNDVNDYGEKYVQKQGASEDEQFQDFAEKESGLVQFFKNNPGVYNLELYRNNQAMYRNTKSYRVKLAVVDLLESGDEE